MIVVKKPPHGMRILNLGRSSAEKDTPQLGTESKLETETEFNFLMVFVIMYLKKGQGNRYSRF